MSRSEDRNSETGGGVPGRPALDSAKAESIARFEFGVDGEARPLPSDRDANFRIDVDGRPVFVLKVMNSDADPDFVACQIEALALADRAGLPVPQPIAAASRDGERIRRVPLGDGTGHLVWMVRWIEGTPLGSTNPVDAGVGTDVGRLLGRLDGALSDFEPAAAHRELDWDVARAAQTVNRYIESIPDEGRRALVRKHMDRSGPVIESALRPSADVRRAVIHGDANDFNVLVGPPEADGRSITGLLDFGDMHFTLLAAEPAVAAAYLMMRTPDPIGMMAAVAAGYHESNPLRPAELDLLYPLVCARLCISVCMSARQRAMEPENDYLGISEEGAWRLLGLLEDVHPTVAGARVRVACGRPPVPATARVIEALRQRKEIAAVVDPDPASSPVRVLDFSAGSTEFDFDDLTIPGRAMERIFGRPASSGGAPAAAPGGAAAGAPGEAPAVGIGRYGEARLAYGGDRFRTATGGMRTRHLGIDLFLPAGSVVRCPMDGVVHSTSDDRTAGDYGPCVIVEHELAASDGPVTFHTLYGHLGAASLERCRPGVRLAAGDAIGEIGEASENGGWVPHLHFQIVTHLLGSEGTYPGVAAPDEFDAWAGLAPDPNLILRIPGLEPCDPPAERRDILERRRRLLGPSLSLHYDRPLHIVRGHMQYLYDSEGRRYLDCVNNVAHVGHANPRVVEAERRQAAALNTNTRYLHRNLVEYAERLAATLPDPLEVCYFVNSGSEANDLAVRLARCATGRRDMIVLDGAYHGHLTTLIDLSPYKFDGPGGTGRPADTHVVPMPDPYRGPHRGGDAGARYAEYVRDACLSAAQVGGVAAMIAESVPGCGGQIVPPAGYLAEAAGYVRAAGGLFIADEVQVGMGRPGESFWGFEPQGVVPDIVVIGKPIGNGHPLAAVVTTRAVAEAFANGMEYFNTFGGNPVSCAIGLAVLDEIEREGLQDRAGRVGGALMSRLSALKERHDVIGDVRGVGLFLGMELVRDRETLEPAADQARYVVNRLARRGILTSTDGPHDNVIKIKPPLTFSEEDAEQLSGALDDVLGHDFVRRG